MDAQKFRDFVSDQIIKAAGGEIQLTQIKLVVLAEIAAQLMELNETFAWPEPHDIAKQKAVGL
jgi:hypothetical protein